jgi:hypothetical protein
VAKTSSWRKVKGRLGIIAPSTIDNLKVMTCHHFEVRCFTLPLSPNCPS